MCDVADVLAVLAVEQKFLDFSRTTNEEFSLQVVLSNCGATIPQVFFMGSR